VQRAGFSSNKTVSESFRTLPVQSVAFRDKKACNGKKAWARLRAQERTER